jgi:hypothetical protein
MIILKTVYPCKNCKQEVDPNFKHCLECGAIQDYSGDEHFNIFRRQLWGGEQYSMVYGATILSYDDIVELAEEQSGEGCFIGSFIPAEQDREHHIKLAKWIPIVNGQPGLNQGSQTIEISNLE